VLSIYSPSGANAGIGFAVPVDIVSRIVPQLIAHGRVIRPALGIVPAEDPIAEQLGIRGVVVLEVVPGGAADKAGFVPTRRTRYGDIALGDVIVKVDERTVENLNDLFDTLESKRIGQKVNVTVIRDGRRKVQSVLLEPSR
jgi:S1-C subfamily serine protease